VIPAAGAQAGVTSKARKTEPSEPKAAYADAGWAESPRGPSNPTEGPRLRGSQTLSSSTTAESLPRARRARGL
jgi:hypothetical protein